MTVNGALQGRGPSIGDECADMTVIHGDVYSKLREGERFDLRGIKIKKDRGEVKEEHSLQDVFTELC